MKVYAINGSAKGEPSNSRAVIAMVQDMLGSGAEVEVVSQIRQYRKPDDSVFPAMAASDVLFIATSLYVDALPSTLMSFLERYAAYLAGQGKASRVSAQRVFACVNCGFYEGEQNALALDIIAHFCAASSLRWSGGVGLGTGEMIESMKDAPPEMFIRKSVTRALRAISDAIAFEPDGALAENIFAHHGFPRFLYKLAGESRARAEAKKNGLKTRDLFRHPLGKSLKKG